MTKCLKCGKLMIEHSSDELSICIKFFINFLDKNTDKLTDEQKFLIANAKKLFGN